MFIVIHRYFCELFKCIITNNGMVIFITILICDNHSGLLKQAVNCSKHMYAHRGSVTHCTLFFITHRLQLRKCPFYSTFAPDTSNGLCSKNSTLLQFHHIEFNMWHVSTNAVHHVLQELWTDALSGRTSTMADWQRTIITEWPYSLSQPRVWNIFEELKLPNAILEALVTFGFFTTSSGTKAANFAIFWSLSYFWKLFGGVFFFHALSNAGSMGHYLRGATAYLVFSRAA